MRHPSLPLMLSALGLLLLQLPCEATEPAAPAASAASAPAESSTTPTPRRLADSRPGDGQASRAWLSAQTSGQQASSIQPTLSGPVLRKVHERYVNSFGLAIPERFPANR